MRRRIFVLLASAFVAGCGPDGRAEEGLGATDGGAGGAPAGAEACGNGWDDDADGAIDEDCACALGASQPCWPGTAEQRNLGECRDGVQTCVGSDEFTAWGPCEEGVMPAPDEFGDGIDQDCSGGDGPAGCAGSCTPGATRWCDTPTDCTWGTQTCNPDGTWGTCVETATPEPCRDPGEGLFGIPSFYDTDCCLELPDACCQNYPAQDSVGECDGVTTCG